VSNAITHQFEIRVRYVHTDKMGVVYNGNYLTFFEIGRTELLRSIGLPYTDLEKNGFMLPVLEAHIEYKSPAFYDDMIVIETTIIPERAALLTISYDVTRNGTLLSTGYTKHSFVESDSWRPIKPPKMFTEAITNAIPKVEL